MTTYSNLNNEPELLKMKTKNDEVKDSNYKTEEHNSDILLKSLEIDNEYYKKKYKSLGEKKVLLIISEILIASASTFSSSTMGSINPGASIIVSSSTALLTSFAVLITKEHVSNLKIRYTKLRDWVNDFICYMRKF